MKRSRRTRDLVLTQMNEQGEGETDEESDENADDDARPSRMVGLPLTKLVSAWTFQMFNLDPLSLATGDATLDRPALDADANRGLTASHADLEGMREDTREYIKRFPLSPTRLYEQDCMHEMEYAAMYRGQIPKDNNWGFYLYMTATHRQKRILDYQNKVGGAKLVITTSPLQMRSSSKSDRLRRSGSVGGKRRRSEDKKIIKLMKKKLSYDSPEPTNVKK